MYIDGLFSLLNKHPFSIRVCQSDNSSFRPTICHTIDRFAVGLIRVEDHRPFGPLPFR